jgi:hypothetical protein
MLTIYRDVGAASAWNGGWRDSSTTPIAEASGSGRKYLHDYEATGYRWYTLNDVIYPHFQDFSSYFHETVITFALTHTMH